MKYWAAQTALRDVIGKTMLSDMLEGRDKISSALQKIIDERTEPWGINVIELNNRHCPQFGRGVDATGRSCGNDRTDDGTGPGTRGQTQGR